VVSATRQVSRGDLSHPGDAILRGVRLRVFLDSMARRLAWLLCGVLGAFGCNGGSGQGLTGAGGTGGGVPSLQAFCEQADRHVSAALARCYGGTLADWLNPPESCQKIAAPGARIQYDATKAKACLDTLAAKAATECLLDTPCYSEVIKGLVPNGQACTLWVECGPNVPCLSRDDRMCGQSVCAAPAPIGASCFPTCDDGGVCDPQIDKCVPIVWVDQNGSCGDAVDRLCKDDLVCVFVGDALTGTCQPDTSGAAGGCTSDWDCADYLAEFCSSLGGTCKPRLALGASCEDNPTACAISAACDPVTKRCVKAGHPGEPCGTVLNWCFSSYCDFTIPETPTCRGFMPNGGACRASSECKSGVCGDGLCKDCGP
jgi:hypothetical protein